MPRSTPNCTQMLPTIPHPWPSHSEGWRSPLTLTLTLNLTRPLTLTLTLPLTLTLTLTLTLFSHRSVPS